MKLLFTNNLPIFEQLQIEEALLRASDETYCLINAGSPPAIVMGISGKADELLDLPKVCAAQIPVIKRFSGGGTVVVDENTLFVTFIGTDLARPFPKEIMEWTFQHLHQAFNHPHFVLKENDFCMGEKKCGGNAQYIQKNRVLQHTSFLWDFEMEKMNLLLLPKKRPEYRLDRSHEAFLCKLREYFSSKEVVLEGLLNYLHSNFSVTEMTLYEAQEMTKRPHRKSTCLFPLNK